MIHQGRILFSYFRELEINKMARGLPKTSKSILPHKIYEEQIGQVVGKTFIMDICRTFA